METIDANIRCIQKLTNEKGIHYLALSVQIGIDARVLFILLKCDVHLYPKLLDLLVLLGVVVKVRLTGKHHCSKKR